MIEKNEKFKLLHTFLNSLEIVNYLTLQNLHTSWQDLGHSHINTSFTVT